MSKTKEPADSVPSASSLPGLWVAPFSPCPHVVEGESPGVSSSSHQGTSPIG